MSEIHKCDHEGCENINTTECILPALEEGISDLVYYYCVEHAKEEGFCWGCGGFWAGVDSFDFGGWLCENCRDSEYEDEEYDEYDSPEYDHYGL